MQKYLDRFTAEIAPQPLTLARAHVLFELYRRGEKYDQALTVLDKAIAQFPDQAADLHFDKSLVYQFQENTAAAEQELLKALRLNPDHEAANNTLGYLWTEQNKNLDQSLQMIQKAVDADPSSAAYRDSLGWVYYKKGDFAAAADHLRRARNSEGGDDVIIVDHLGDALWRMGQKEEAVRQWRFALEQAQKPQARDDSEMKRALENLRAKLKAVAENADPPVAQVPVKP